MNNRKWISLIGIALALGASTGSASARRIAHHWHRHAGAVHVIGRPAWRHHAWIMGNRQTHVYYVQRVSSDLPARANRIYFSSAADARAAGYQPAGRDAVPIDPRLTWRNGRNLPSLGKHREPPPPPKWIQKPASPPTEQQPKVTPTEPMPN